MPAPSFLQRHPGVRWLAPIGVAAVVAAIATGVFRATEASTSLPRTSPAALIAAVRSNNVEGFSGTVVSHLALGLPEVPTLPGGEEETSFSSLLSGSHTMQVWYGGADRQRIELLGATDETDLFRDGSDVWQWSSSDGVALHAKLPDRDKERIESPAAPASLTPIGLARSALAAIDPSTKVEMGGTQSVADRSAYQLVLTPRSTATKVGAVHISIDGATKVPLGVQVYPRGSSSAAIDVSFTAIRFGAQADRNFAFIPPPTARVRELRSPHAAPQGGSTAADAVTFGNGWTTVLRLKPDQSATVGLRKNGFVKALTPVSGAWGKGRLLDSALLSVLVTSDGRVFAGTVEPADLYTAADSK